MVNSQSPHETNAPSASGSAPDAPKSEDPLPGASPGGLLRMGILWAFVSICALVIVFIAVKFSIPPPVNDTAAAGMISFKGGKFMAGHENGGPDEPRHEVELAPYAIDRLEVTVEDYLACVEAGACGLPGGHNGWCNRERKDALKHPMNCLNHAQAGAYCAWKGKRLPTETEWERAAKGSASRSYPWGETSPIGLACFDRARTKEGSCASGSFPTDKSPDGVLDMGGNVAEWTSSDYCRPDGTGCRPNSAVTRGGSWDTEQPTFARTTFRDFVPKYERGYNLGFRCARTL